jgi:hypothetical protein
MKILSFLRWKYRQFTFEDKLWNLGTFLIIFGYFIHINLLIAGFAIWFGILFNTFVITKYRKDYEEFKNEQNKLFETIKHSDQK